MGSTIRLEAFGPLRRKILRRLTPHGKRQTGERASAGRRSVRLISFASVPKNPICTHLHLGGIPEMSLVKILLTDRERSELRQ